MVFVLLDGFLEQILAQIVKNKPHVLDVIKHHLVYGAQIPKNVLVHPRLEDV